MYRQWHRRAIFRTVLLRPFSSALDFTSDDRATHHHHLPLARHLDLALAEMHERGHPCDARAVEQVAVVREEVQGQADLPDLVDGRASGARGADDAAKKQSMKGR